MRIKHGIVVSIACCVKPSQGLRFVTLRSAKISAGSPAHLSRTPRFSLSLLRNFWCRRLYSRVAPLPLVRYRFWISCRKKSLKARILACASNAA